MPRGLPVHKLSNIDYDSLTADCANCGSNIVVKLKVGKPRCNEAIKALKRIEGEKYAKRSHGLTALQARKLRENSSCAICGSTEKLNVDHCHATGKVRGILCASHNLAIGMFRDDVRHLALAIAYLNGERP